MFTWIPIHQEAIGRILQYRDNQAELLILLREMEQKGLRVISLKDKGPGEQPIELGEIDPFTFFATFNRRITDSNRRENWAFLKTRWGLQAAVPDDFTGIPILHPMRSWLLPWAMDRPKDHVTLLWQLAAQGAEGDVQKIEPDLFDRCVNLRQVGIGVMTIGLFWINPEHFLPTDKKSLAYGRSKGVALEPSNYRSYCQWLSEMTARFGNNYPQVSHEAHLHGIPLPPIGPEPHSPLAAPFDVLFGTRELADEAFGLLRWTLGCLGVSSATYAEDCRIALTLPQNKPQTLMRLNFGNWAILSFYASAGGERSLHYVCRKDLVPESAQGVWEGQMADLIDDKAYASVETNVAGLQGKSQADRDAFRSSLLDIAKHFAEWKAGPWERHNKPELLRMVFDDAQREHLLRSGLPGDGPMPPKGKETGPRPGIEPYDKKKAMKGLFLAEAQFDETLAALREKKNVVLQGAPGVGKTYVAKRLAYALIGSNDPRQIEMIQFHQSYSYEDFIQGFRPTPKGHFDLKYGIFHQFCRRAQREEALGKPYVFIIDEINRGNLSKIFGELMMLIEPDKRGKEHAIPLAYSQDADDKFYIPENLHLIGMMNTADRSLAMVDYALRRRFRFIELRPEFSSPEFGASLAKAGAELALVTKIITRMNALNAVIAADTKNLGPGYQIGHSYFCPRNGITPDEDWYQRVIKAEIVPLIQEYWFDNDQKVREQQLALLT